MAYSFRRRFFSSGGSCGVFGVGVRGVRRGLQLIIPNRFSPDPMYAAIFSHTRIALRIDDGPLQELEPNTLRIWDLSSKCVYYGAAGASWEISWLQFYPSLYESSPFWKDVPLNSSIRFQDDSPVDRFFLAAWEEFKMHEAPDQELLRNILDGLLLASRRAVRENGEGRKQVPPRFLEVRKYIIDNALRPLSLPALARRVNLEPAYFCRQFKACFGVPPVSMQINERLDEAFQLLENGGMTVQEISRTVGYEDFCYFSRLFKKRFGTSPSSLLTKHRVEMQ